jgi:hypothetical protein
MGSSAQAQQNPIEKVVGRVMGGSTAAGDEHPTIVVGQEYGRPPTAQYPTRCTRGRGGRGTPSTRASTTR